MSWTDETIARLREHHAKGLTATQSAVDLNLEFEESFSRNSVVGKRARLGLCGVRNSTRPIARGHGPVLLPHKQHRAFTDRVGNPDGLSGSKVRVGPLDDPAPIILPHASAPGARMLPLLELSFGQCRYVHGDARSEAGALFCAADVVPGSSWCPCHRQLCVTGTAPKIRLPDAPLTPEQQARSDKARARMTAFHARQRKAVA